MGRLPAVDGRLLIGTTITAAIDAFVAPQLPALVGAGWEVHLTSAPGPLATDCIGQGVVRHEIPMTRDINPLGDTSSLIKWITLLQDVRPSVVLASTPKAGMLAMVASRYCGVPRRVFLHRGARWETETGRRRMVLMAADKLTMRAATDVLAVSVSLADLVVRHGLAMTRPTVLGHGGSKGVDLERFRPVAKPTRRDHPPTIGFVGRLSGDKGIDTVIKVYYGVRRRVPEAALRVAGSIDDADPPDDAVVALLRDDPGVRWSGSTDDVPAFLNDIDVLVLPSHREGLPNVVIEAAACGVPAVGWRVTGVCDAIQHGRSGFLVNAGDETEMVNSVVRILAAGDGAYLDRCRTWATHFDQAILTRSLVRYLAPNTIS